MYANYLKAKPLDRYHTGSGWPLEVYCGHDKATRTFNDYDHLLGKSPDLALQCIFSHAYNAEHMDGLCPQYLRVRALMQDSGGAPPHTITDNLTPGAAEANASELLLPASVRRRRSPLETEEETQDLREIGTEAEEPPPAQITTLNSKNLAASESEKCARIASVAEVANCAPPLLLCRAVSATFCSTFEGVSRLYEVQKMAGLTLAEAGNKRKQSESSQSDSAFSDAFSLKADRDRAAHQQQALDEANLKLQMNREKLDDDAEWRYYDRLLTLALAKYPDRDLDDLEAEIAAKVAVKMEERRRKRTAQEQQPVPWRDPRPTQMRRTEEPSPSLGRNGTETPENDDLDIFRS